MKKYLGLLAACLMVVLASPASAADQLGVYVVPKFVYGLTEMDSVKGHWTDTTTGDSGSIRIGSKTDDTFGGSIAIGYDFEKRFGLPIRGEVEYAAFSRAEAKRSYTSEWNERENSHRPSTSKPCFLTPTGISIPGLVSRHMSARDSAWPSSVPR